MVQKPYGSRLLAEVERVGYGVLGLTPRELDDCTATEVVTAAQYRIETELAMQWRAGYLARCKDFPSLDTWLGNKPGMTQESVNDILREYGREPLE